MHGPKGVKRKSSDYGTQLREKQKAKRTYGLSEKQFANYVVRATKVKGKTGEALLQLLEGRLDNIIYRLGFVPSRTMARQIVSHGHVMVNSKTVNVPSFATRVNDVVTLSSKAMEMTTIKKMLEKEELKVPKFLERKAAAGKVLKVPSRDEIMTEVEEQLIVEYYSR
jgi:small subunit ribosomal protein S4